MTYFVVFGVELEHVFVNLLESESVSSFKIKTKNDASVKCNLDVTIGFPNFEKFRVGVESEYDIRKSFGVGLEPELNLSE